MVLPNQTLFSWEPRPGHVHRNQANAVEVGFYRHAVRMRIEQGLNFDPMEAALDDLERWVGALQVPDGYVVEAYFDIVGFDDGGPSERL